MRALGLVVALALVGSTAPAAHAETWSARDARGDAETLVYSPDPPPCGTTTVSTAPVITRQDLTGLRVDHGAEDVTVRLRMRDVARRDHSTSWYVHLLTPGRAYALDVLPAQRGEAADAVLTDEPDLPVDPAACGVTYQIESGSRCGRLGVRLDAVADDVELTVPRRCLHEPRWVRVGSDVSGAFTGTEETGYSVTSDAWSPRGASSASYPTYGPRVHAG